MIFANNRLTITNKHRNNHKIMRTHTNSSIKAIFMILNSNKIILNQGNLVVRQIFKQLERDFKSSEIQKMT